MSNTFFSTEKKSDILVITCPDELLGGKEGTEFSQILHESSGISKVVVDLSPVRIINSTGVGMLVGGYTTCKKNDVDFVLAGAGTSISSILKMTHLDKVLTMFPSVEEASK